MESERVNEINRGRQRKEVEGKRRWKAREGVRERLNK